METTKKHLSPRELEKISKESFVKDIKEKYKQEEGWFLTDKGFPDYILFNKKTKELIFYELKANGHNFHKFQKQVMKILKTSEKRSGRVRRYMIDPESGKIKGMEEKGEEEIEGKGWEGVEDIGIL